MIWLTRKHGLCLCLLIFSQYYGAAQLDGYISIDCGATANSTDPDTGIVWTTDESYVSTGTNQIVTSVSSGAPNERHLQTIRSFPPDRSKHCYTLPASSNSSYLLRAVFSHQLTDMTTKFDLSIDSTVISSLDWTKGNTPDTLQIREYVVAATNNRLNFCLLPTNGTAFISTLELRPLVEGMYDVVFHGKYLRMVQRVNCGVEQGAPPIRYPHDVYDRIWWSSWWYTGSGVYNGTNTTSDISVNVPDNPPLAVMQSAWVSSVPVPLEWSMNTQFFVNSTFYTNHFFAEIQNTGDIRIVNMDVNGENTRNNYSISPSIVAVAVEAETTQIKNENMAITTSSTNFSVSASSESVLGPLLNAFEIYRVIEVAVQSSTDVGDADALEVVKTNFGLSSWTGDPCVPVPYSWLDCNGATNPRVTKIDLRESNLVGTIPARLAELTALTDLWLDNNKIRGGIPDLSRLINLKTLHLQNNSLTGGIPSTLASLPLTELFLSNNNLSGPIPAALANINGLELNTSGNANLCAPTENCTVWPIDPSDDNGGGGNRAIDPSGDNSGGLIGGIIGGVVGVLAIMGFLVWRYCRRRSKTTAGLTSIRSVDLEFVGEQGSSGSAAAAVKKARAFTLAEVQEATQENKILGKGGFGTVLYGKLVDGTEVAVKENSANSNQGTTEFLIEVSVLSRVHHNNLVSLLGYCEENGKRILIYEYMSQGTLREQLHEGAMKGRITWKQRLQIALDAAYGLEYLHNHCTPKIIHRDIKSSNILLANVAHKEQDLLAKVADFGISKLQEDLTLSISTEVRGTPCYWDPEYAATRKLSKRSDVYSFGVVLLEIICGKPASYSQADFYSLVEWARDQWNGSDVESLVDPRLGTYNVDAMWEVVKLAMDCVQDFSANRPSMKQVVQRLTTANDIEHGIVVDGGSQADDRSRTGGSKPSSTQGSEDDRRRIESSKPSSTRGSEDSVGSFQSSSD